MASLVIELIKYIDENHKLRQQVEELSWDEPFGMLTRPAFLQYCRQLPGKPRWVAFIDLNDIGCLNRLHRYTEMDRRIRALFAGIHERQGIAARWYSGDEIVILSSGARNPHATMMDLVFRGREVGLEFSFQTGVWDSRRETIEMAIEALSSHASHRKRFHVVRNKEVSYGA